MSSKGTIFLTSNNDRVYDETNDWSIVLEISKSEIDRVEIYKEYLEDNHYILKDYEYIIISTKARYRFTDLIKDSVDANVILLSNSEIRELETDSLDAIKHVRIKVYLKKESEWYKDYITIMLSRLGSEKRLIQIKINKLLLT